MRVVEATWCPAMMCSWLVLVVRFSVRLERWTSYLCPQFGYVPRDFKVRVDLPLITCLHTCTLPRLRARDDPQVGVCGFHRLIWKLKIWDIEYNRSIAVASISWVLIFSLKSIRRYSIHINACSSILSNHVVMLHFNPHALIIFSQTSIEVFKFNYKQGGSKSKMSLLIRFNSLIKIW